MNLLPNYLDDILNISMDKKRRLREIQNGDGTVSFEDVSIYDQIGSRFGAAEINQIIQAILDLENAKVETVDPLTATEEGFAADAKLTGDAIKKLQASFSTAANSIGNAIAALGVSVPSGASLDMMATIISSSLRKKVSNESASGSLAVYVKSSQTTYTGIISFGKTFSGYPTVSATYNNNGKTATATITNITRTGCTYTFTFSTNSAVESLGYLSWAANYSDT